LDFVTYRAHLARVGTARDDEGVGQPEKLFDVEHDSVAPEL
jgi:hypothetical protein